MKLKLSVATASSIDRAVRRYYYGESTTASPTTTPSALGIDGEPNFDFGLDDDTVGGFLAGGSAAPVPPEIAQKLDELGQRMGVLEKMMTTQVRAMRALLEMLVEKSGFSREEFIDRVRGNKKPE
jgi:type IV pilus assembly protein PilB